MSYRPLQVHRPQIARHCSKVLKKRINQFLTHCEIIFKNSHRTREGEPEYNFCKGKFFEQNYVHIHSETHKYPEKVLNDLSSK